MKTFIDKKLRELDKKFLNPNTLDSSHLYRPELEGKVYPEFKSFLKQALEECEKEVREEFKTVSCWCGEPIDIENSDCVGFKLCENHATEA